TIAPVAVRLSAVAFLTPIESCCRAAATGIFPLGLGWQGESPALAVALGQPIAKGLRVVPRHVLGWESTGVEALDLIFAPARRAVIARVLADQGLVLFLRHLVFAEIIVLADFDLMLEFVVFSTLFVRRRAHFECPFWNPDEFHFHAVAQFDGDFLDRIF